jgi:hypothetical protein
MSSCLPVLDRPGVIINQRREVSPLTRTYDYELLSPRPGYRTHLGHSLTAPRFLGFMPPAPRDEADLFDAGEHGHGGIETEALANLLNAESIQAVYFGNWQRDMSQMIVPAMVEHLGSVMPFLSNLIFEVLDVMAEAKFNQRLDRVRFGTYRWEEHIDNPRQYGIAVSPATYSYVPASQRTTLHQPEARTSQNPTGLVLWTEDPQLAIPRYIMQSRLYVLVQLLFATRSGFTRRGLEHFGNAMHTVEDFYAHSNFIELGLNHLNRTVNPTTGHDSRACRQCSCPQRCACPPLRDSRGRFRLTTGVFLLGDTVVSLKKLLLKHIEGRAPGEPPSNVGRRVIRVLVLRLLGPQVLTLYDQIMSAWEGTGIPAIGRQIMEATGVAALERLIEEQITYPLHQAIARLLQPLVAASARRTGREAFAHPSGGRVIEISHSRLSKDDRHHRLHPRARRLAINAVRSFFPELRRAWSLPGRAQMPNLNSTAFPRLVNNYMNHPLGVSNWWVPILSSTR